MSWAEVKKINSDLNTPLNELIEYEKEPYSYEKLLYSATNSTYATGAELSLNGPALIYAITGYGLASSSLSANIKITLDDKTYTVVLSTTGNGDAWASVGFYTHYLIGLVGSVSYSDIELSTLAGNSGSSEKDNHVRILGGGGIPLYRSSARFFMPTANSTKTVAVSESSAYQYDFTQPLDKPIKVNNLAKITSTAANRIYLTILYKPLS